jgi:hypothetical protein
MKHTDEYKTGYLDALKDMAEHIEHTAWIQQQSWLMTADAIKNLQQIGTTDEV